MEEFRYREEGEGEGKDGNTREMEEVNQGERRGECQRLELCER